MSSICATGSVQFQNSVQDHPPQQFSNAVVYKIKEIINTGIPDDRQLGDRGGVYICKTNRSLAVKKSAFNLTNEFLLGLQMSHPCLVQMHQLKILKDRSFSSLEFKMVMDKIKGTKIAEYYSSENKIPYEILKELLKDAEDLVVYLFEQQIAWKNLKDHQIFVTKTNRLKLCDFKEWSFEKNLSKLTLDLLLGTMELTGWLVKSSVIRSQGKDEKLEEEILLPQNFFKNDKFCGNINNHFFITLNEKVLDKIRTELEQKSKEDLKFFLQHYVASVREALRKIFEGTVH